MTKRDTRIVVIWKGDPERVALTNSYDRLISVGNARPVDTLPITEFMEDTGNANSDQWNAIKAIVEFIENVHDIQHGWYITCAEPGSTSPEWSMAFVTQGAYDAIQEQKGINPPTLYLDNGLLCIQCML